MSSKHIEQAQRDANRGVKPQAPSGLSQQQQQQYLKTYNDQKSKNDSNKR